MDTNKVKCIFCEENQSKYSCPRCLVRYCSIQCYQHQMHSECSEKFYKEQVLSELKGMKGTEEEKEKIMNILKKLKKQDDSAKSKDDNTDISERLNAVNLDNADAVWEKLTPHERDMFQRYISKGNLDFMPMWAPWWCMEKRSKIVEVSRENVPHPKQLPQLIKDLPQVKDILRDKPPDSNLKYCLMDILLTYTCTQRIFNGDIYDAPGESVCAVLQISNVLSENKIYSDLDSTLYCFVRNLTGRSDIDIDPITVCLQDLYQVVTSDDSYVLRVLSDLYVYLKKCRKLFKKENAELSQQLFKMSKKVYFYAAYCREFQTDIKLLGSGIREIQKQLLEDRNMLIKEKEEIEEHLHKLKPKEKNNLIEEM